MRQSLLRSLLYLLPVSYTHLNTIIERGAHKMGLMTFKGGVHPFEGKDLSKDKPIRELLPKGELVYPLSQHIGAPATPIVAVGDSVLKGQKLSLIHI